MKMSKQKLLFVVVGIANTAIDFVFLNIFSAIVGLPVALANVISMTIAMGFSYFANHTLVFDSGKSHKQQAGKFLAVTLFSLYVIQTIIILFLTIIWVWPSDFIYSIAGDIGLNVSEGFVQTNTAKLVATAFSMIFNFVMYDRYVFKVNK